MDKSKLFSILRLSLLGETCDNLNMTSPEWDELFHLGMRHKIIAILTDGIAQLPEPQKPPRQMWLRFCAEKSKIETRYHHHKNSLIELLRFFQDKGIRTLVLKGYTLSRYYPVPQSRDYSDIDIYQFGEYKKADKLLSSELGIKITNNAHHHTKYNFQNTTIENHYDFLNIHTPRSNKSFNALLKDLVIQSKEVHIQDASLSIASPTFNALFLIRHLAGHFVAGQITIRDLCDWRMFLKQYSSQIDWAEVSKTYVQYNMHHFVGTLQGILEDNLSLQPIKGLSRENDIALQDKVLNNILYGDSVASEYQKENIGRIFWKIKRYRANRWKQKICYSDTPLSTTIHSLVSHMLKPQSIIHKV